PFARSCAGIGRRLPPGRTCPSWTVSGSEVTVKTIHHVIDIDAGDDVVWRSLTDEDALASWWSTKVDSPPTAVGARTVWTFAGDFNPVMETIAVDAPREIVWQCVDGHQPWQD